MACRFAARRAGKGGDGTRCCGCRRFADLVFQVQFFSGAVRLDVLDLHNIVDVQRIEEVCRAGGDIIDLVAGAGVHCVGDAEQGDRCVGCEGLDRCFEAGIIRFALALDTGRDQLTALILVRLDLDEFGACGEFVQVEAIVVVEVRITVVLELRAVGVILNRTIVGKLVNELLWRDCLGIPAERRGGVGRAVGLRSCRRGLRRSCGRSSGPDPWIFRRRSPSLP